MSGDRYAIHAIRYGRLERRSPDNFLGGDATDVPMPMDYYVWVAVGAARTVVIDTGFSPAVAQRRNRNITTPVERGLEALGIRPDDIDDVVLTHLHYDHAGNPDLFPNARYHVQHCDLAYATGRCMCHKLIGGNYEADDVAKLVYRNFAGQLALLEGDATLAPGITLHKLGGHTPGMQCVRVETDRGPVVLASDASHHYAHYQQDRVFPVAHDIGGVLEGYRTIRRLIPSDEHVIPGHDPLVMERYPASRPGLEGVAVRLDVPPRP